MTEMQEAVNEYMKREETERHRLEQTEARTAEARAEIAKIRKFKATRGGVDAAKLHFQLMNKKVSAPCETRCPYLCDACR